MLLKNHTGVLTYDATPSRSIDVLTIHKQILTDEQGEPIGVHIPYREWLLIEKQLGLRSSDQAEAKNLQRHAGTIRLTQDPVQYQQQMRDEWT